MRILLGATANDIRDIFLSTFIDMECSYYQDRIANMVQFSDGMCYTGYLWDCLVKEERVSYQYAVNRMEAILEIILSYGIFTYAKEYESRITGNIQKALYGASILRRFAPQFPPYQRTAIFSLNHFLGHLHSHMRNQNQEKSCAI